MATIVKTHIIKIGNSKGVRIPKILLEQARLGEEVELRLEDDHIVIQPAHQVRANWEERFKTMAEQGDDLLLEGDSLIANEWDEDEWEW
ncbi:MAG: AbrB/MazE/SpoVT family DNA-binding domain-containing protein [Candidatus Promineifilaceae bacterium]|nr:AbrB/MazE/SpoVT family DNA-binding domain-containing protein [Candidatus Promineifilaceae bacterium]